MKRAVLMSALLLAGCGGAQTPAEPAAAAPSVAGAWIVDKDATRIAFEGVQSGAVFSGAFEGFDATIILDPDDLRAASINVLIDMSSARTGDRQRDAALPGADWFSAKAFPTASFTSENIIRTGEGAYEADGVLSIRGVEKPLLLPFTLAIDGDRATADAVVSLVRTDFGVGQGEFASDQWVGFDVKVTIHVEATR